MTTVRLYHGTNTAAAALAQKRGRVQPLDPHEVAAKVEAWYGLEEDTVWNHCAYEFSRHRQTDVHVYLTGDIRVAWSYAGDGSETLTDALRAAYRLRHPHARGRSTDKHWQKFKARFLAAHGYTATVLKIDVPIEAIPLPEGTKLAAAEWIALAHELPEHPINTLMISHAIPASWIAGEETR